jgi:hypothetical protein
MDFGKVREVFEEEILNVKNLYKLSKIPFHIIIFYLQIT